MHLTCTGLTREKVKEVLDQCKDAGVRNILALRGDPPQGSHEWAPVEGGFHYARDLVKFIRENYGDYFCISVAGFPEGHVDSVFTYEEDLKHLKAKVDAGADLIITQLFYDVESFLKFERDCRAIGITVPIIPGIMAIQSYKGFVRMTSYCKIRVPDFVKDALEPIKDDDEAVKNYGVELGIQMCNQLLGSGRGIHFYTLNLERSVKRILEGLGLSNAAHRTLPWRPSVEPKRKAEVVRPIFWANRPKSYLARTESWDDFPNGRWGDARR
jgi:methylenetetrahydrofolate reductase (NADPH)